MDMVKISSYQSYRDIDKPTPVVHRDTHIHINMMGFHSFHLENSLTRYWSAWIYCKRHLPKMSCIDTEPKTPQLQSKLLNHTIISPTMFMLNIIPINHISMQEPAVRDHKYSPSHPLIFKTQAGIPGKDSLTNMLQLIAL